MADLNPDWLQSVIGVKLVNIASGFAGGIVRGLVNPHYTWPTRISSAIVGGLTAGYATPPVSIFVRRWFDLWGYPSGDLEGSVGFLLGLVGMTICEAAIRWAKRWRDGPPNFPPAPPRASC